MTNEISPTAIDAIKAKAVAAAKASQAKAGKGKLKVKAESKAKPAAEPTANKVEIKLPGGPPLMMRKGSKQATMYGLLLAPKGATVAEVAKACGYEHGTAMSAVHGGRLKRFLKAMGGKLIAEDDEKRGRFFRIVKSGKK